MNKDKIFCCIKLWAVMQGRVTEVICSISYILKFSTTCTLTLSNPLILHSNHGSIMSGTNTFVYYIYGVVSLILQTVQMCMTSALYDVCKYIIVLTKRRNSVLNMMCIS